MYVCNKVSLTNYTDDTIKLNGSILDGLNVLAWQPPNGLHLVWMDEMGKLNTSPVVGFLLMDFKRVAERSEPVARRALLTNSADIGKTLEEWEAIDTFNLPTLSALPAPELITLGVMCKKNCVGEDDVGLPEWAFGHEIIEVEEPIGCFAALGYCHRGEKNRFNVAKRYYVPLLMEGRKINACLN